MDFQDFLALVPKIVKEPLPAHEAHLKMAPIERIRFHENFNTERLNPKIAAVMMLLYPKNKKHIWLSYFEMHTLVFILHKLHYLAENMN